MKTRITPVILLLGILTLDSCEKSDTTTGTPSAPILSLQIGQSYQGGIIAYIDPSGQHGLISASSDIIVSSIYFWGHKDMGIRATAIGTGQANTTAIMNQKDTMSNAAYYCDDYEANGYKDWYLPSKDELNKLYANKIAIGGFQHDYYWSSSEYGTTDAWYQNFSDGIAYHGDKKYDHLIRAIRSF